MRVFLLQAEFNPSGLRLAAALDRESSVSQVETSGDIRRASDADIIIIKGVSGAETIAPRLCLGQLILVVAADVVTAPERVSLLDRGADLVLHGDVSDDEIVAQVRAIARRGADHDHSLVRPNGSEAKIVLDPDRRHVMVLGRQVILTSLEGRLLATFMARPGEVLDSRALMTSVRGAPFSARSTVSAQVRRLRVKIEPDASNPVFIRTVWGAGYAYQPEGDL